MPSILYEVRSQMAHITINRETNLNTITKDMIRELGMVIQDAASNPQVSVIIFTGSGPRHFSAGLDLKSEGLAGPERMAEVYYELGILLDDIEALTKPTIAAINGYAFGAGLELALACDLRICVDQTLLGLPQTRLGLIPGAGGTQRLPRLIGETKALELILTGKRVPALDAYQYGLLNRVVPNDSLEEATAELAEIMIQNSQSAMHHAKRAVKEGMKRDIRAGLGMEREEWMQNLASDDYEIGIRSFFAKKQAHFTRN